MALLSKNDIKSYNDLSRDLTFAETELVVKGVQQAVDYIDPATGKLRPEYAVSVSTNANGTSTSTTASTTAILNFEGANGSAVITDLKSNVWTATGGAVITTAVKKFGTSCLNLASASSIVSTPATNLISLNSVKNKTIEFWMQLKSNILDSRSILSDRGPGGGAVFGLYNQKFVMQSSSGWIFDGSPDATLNTITTGKMYHVAIVIENNTLKVFLDSKLYVSINYSSAIGSATFSIGKENWWSAADVYIDDLKISTASTELTFPMPTAQYTA